MLKGKQVEVFKADISTPEMYEYYARKNFKTRINKYYKTDRTSPFYLDKRTYSRIIKEFNKKIRDAMLYEAFQFRMPCNLGMVSIVKKKVEPYFDSTGKFRNPTPINKAATRELWNSDPEAKKKKKFVYHDNSHSDGYVGKLYYHKTTSKFVNKSGFNIRTSRGIKEKIKEIMTDPYNTYDFFVVEKFEV